MARGKFILIEGLDRAGKSTQCERLVKQLGDATLLKFPNRETTIGKMINEYLTAATSNLSDHAIHLLFSANRWEQAEEIKSLLESGTTIVADRYYYSGIAFSAAKGLDKAWCKAPDVGLPAPDITIFLDVSEDTAKQRGGYGEERYEKLEFQRSVRHVFKEFKETERNFVTVSADTDIDTVETEIWKVVQSLQPGPLAYFS